MELDMEVLRPVASHAAKAIKGIWEARVVSQKFA
jgi:hypothetical protein